MSAETDGLRPKDGFEYYRGEIYWNNFDAINEHLNLLVSGSAYAGWRHVVRDQFGGLKRALFVQCGNGWVERDCFLDGAVQSVIGTDIGEDMLAQARAEAEAIGMPALYVRADTNTLDFEDFEFETIVNHAAFHHIAYLDRAVRSMWRALPAHGFLVGYDYTGPDRNQYPWEMWSNIVTFNESLPQAYQAELRYPHLPTMLDVDPTEAVHSELILEVCRRYFVIEHLRVLGGGVAYPLLYGHHRLHQAQHTPEGQAILASVIEADVAYTRGDPDRSLFNFWVARPKPQDQLDPADLSRWTAEEEAREAAALKALRRYKGPEALEVIYNLIEDLRYRLKHGLR